MRVATLTRIESSDHGTLGRLTAPGLDRIWVMEPPWRDNRRGESCIPNGRYVVVPHHSPRYGRCLLVTGTGPRTHILVHPGNLGGDRALGLHTHTLGCQLPGLREGWLVVRGRRQRAVLASRTAWRRLMTWADDRPYTLEIVTCWT